MQNRRLTAKDTYIVLPGHDNVDVEWDELFTEEARNAHAGSDDIIARARRNAAIGNTKQVRRITLP
jgi:glyoxylase-like metal-dependent hydrolase (beta-lactamase superfamily II)